MGTFGLCLSPFLTDSYADLVALAREAEDCGFNRVFIPEGNNDGLMCCDAIASATGRIGLASWIVNIYLRQPSLCAAAAAMVQERAGGRFILGLGVSHRPLLETLGIKMEAPRTYLRDYIVRIRAILAGEKLGRFQLRPPPSPIPVHVAALALETVELGAEMADGLMLDNCSPPRLRTAIDCARATLGRVGRRPSELKISTGVLVFVDERRERAYEAARQNIGRYAMLPAYNRLFAHSGFAAEARIIAEAAAGRDPAAAAAAVTDRMVEELSIAGPPALCRERLDQYQRLGADCVILRPNPVAEDYPRTIHRSFEVFAPML